MSTKIPGPKNRVWTAAGRKRIGDANRNRSPEVIKAGMAKREANRQARKKAGTDPAQIRFEKLKEQVLLILPQCGATSYEFLRIFKTLGGSRRGMQMLLDDGTVTRVGFGSNRRYFLSSVDTTQFVVRKRLEIPNARITEAQAQRISKLRPRPSLTLLAEAVAKAKRLSPENFAVIDEPGLYLLHATGSPEGPLYYVGVSQNLNARLCPGSNGSNHYGCYVSTPYNYGGNIRMWNHIQKYGIDSLYYTVLRVFDKPLTPEEIADIETAWIQILPKGRRANASNTSVGAATVSAEIARERVKKVSHGTVELKGDYTHAKTKISAHCLICDHRWPGTPSVLFRSELCPRCSYEAMGMEKRMTHEEFVTLCGIANSNNIIIGKFETSKDRVRTKCRSCGHEWSAWPSVLLGWGNRKGVGGSCKKCAWGRLTEIRTLSFEEAAQRLYDAFGDTQTLITYNGQNDVQFFCNIHKRPWEANFGNALRGVGCPTCVSEHLGDAARLPDEEVINRAHPSLEILKILEDTIIVRCRVCGHEPWETARRNVTMGSECPYCTGRKTTLTEADNLEMLRLHEEDKQSIWKIAELFHCSGQKVLNVLRTFPTYTPPKRYDHEQVLKQLLTIFPKEGLRKGEIQRTMLERFDVKLDVCECVCKLALERNQIYKEPGKMGRYCSLAAKKNQTPCNS